jgi:hypothetical protein
MTCPPHVLFQRNARPPRDLAGGRRELHFTKGRNTILFKLYNGTNLMFFPVAPAPCASPTPTLRCPI